MVVDIDKIITEAKQKAQEMKNMSPLEIMAQNYNTKVEQSVSKFVTNLATKAAEKYADSLAEVLGVSVDEVKNGPAYKNYVKKVTDEESLKQIVAKYIYKTSGKGEKVVERWKKAMLGK